MDGVWIAGAAVLLIGMCYVFGIALGALRAWVITGGDCSCNHPLSLHYSDGTCNGGEFEKYKGESRRQWVGCRCVRFDGRVPRRLRHPPVVPASRQEEES